MRTLIAFITLSLRGAAQLLRSTWLRAAWAARGVSIARGAVLRSDAGGSLDLGPGVSVGLGSLLLSTTEHVAPGSPRSQLRVGAGTAINEYCNLRACGGAIVIGHKCIVAQMVTMVASNHGSARGAFMVDQAWSASPHSVEVGDDVWIGASVVLLPGSRVGAGSIIAAGAVVRGTVPPGQVWGGVPARFLRHRHGDIATAAHAAR